MYVIILVINLYGLSFLIISFKLVKTLFISMAEVKLFYSKTISNIKVIINKIIAPTSIFI